MRLGQGWFRILAGIFVIVAVSGALVFSQEEPIEIDLLPHSVLDALKSKFPNAKSAKAYKEEYVGRSVYKITMMQKRQNIAATVAENGGILEVEKELSGAELPEQVSRAIMAKYENAKFAVREFTQIKYRVTAKTEEGEKIEFTVDPSGLIEEVESQ